MFGIDSGIVALVFLVVAMYLFDRVSEHFARKEGERIDQARARVKARHDR